MNLLRISLVVDRCPGRALGEGNAALWTLPGANWLQQGAVHAFPGNDVINRLQDLLRVRNLLGVRENAPGKREGFAGRR